MITHIVAAGETLSRIGVLYGVPWRDIATENGLAAPWLLRPGDRLRIRDAERRTPPIRGYDLQVLPTVNNAHWDALRSIRWIIVHDPGVTASPAALLRAMRTTKSPVSYHRIFSDEERPVVYELVPRGMVAWHAGAGTRIPGTGVRNAAVNASTWSLSVMHPMPAESWPALVWALADMVISAGLPNAGVILAHREISTVPGRRSDPRGIDMDRLRADVQERLDTPPF